MIKKNISDKKPNMKRKGMMIILAMAAALSAAVSCDKTGLDHEPVYLEVNANNISGHWQLVEVNGKAFNEGTYVYIDIVRNDRTYTIYQNTDGFKDSARILTGSYYIETDPELGAIIRGNYDHDSGDWKHRYIIKDLTADQMVWVAKDAADYVQKYKRVDVIPVASSAE